MKGIEFILQHGRLLGLGVYCAISEKKVGAWGEEVLQS